MLFFAPRLFHPPIYPVAMREQSDPAAAALGVVSAALQGGLRSLRDGPLPQLAGDAAKAPGDASFKDVVRRRRQEEAAAALAVVGSVAKKLGKEAARRGGAALKAAAVAALHPDGQPGVPQLVGQPRAAGGGAAQQAEPRESSSERRRGGGPSPAAMLAVAALGCALGVGWADANEAERPRRQLLLKGARRTLGAAQARRAREFKNKACDAHSAAPDPYAWPHLRRGRRSRGWATPGGRWSRPSPRCWTCQRSSFC